ncbi:MULTISPECIES: hypothetical protein [Vibrio]|uniref:Uncharacterized protein n=1 Tax=Vibrio atlanticus TaxID=693153 RepID=A0A1C3IZ97_9VIBR|nr:hypothetical protein [Vibrio atlanticus]CAH6874985.1 conserved hypothetical protein [Vibrio chagasii]CAH7093928.1 conserved hypothetical protein [Vibrio chagasii]SBS66729.1 hypothetical protein VAT7223_03330 [Vibrio atlanticus]
MSQKVEKENEVDLFTIVKEGQSPKLSPKSESFLEYQIAYKEDDQEFYIRVSKNSSSGLFSNSWVRLEAIFALLDDQVGKTLKSTALKPVITGGSSNSSGFLAAILRTISILDPVPDNVFLHQVSERYEVVKTELRALASNPD